MRLNAISIVLLNTGICLVPEYFYLIPEQIALKRNKSCIALGCFILDYLPYSGIFLFYFETDLDIKLNF